MPPFVDRLLKFTQFEFVWLEIFRETFTFENAILEKRLFSILIKSDFLKSRRRFRLLKTMNCYFFLVKSINCVQRAFSWRKCHELFMEKVWKWGGSFVSFHNIIWMHALGKCLSISFYSDNTLRHIQNGSTKMKIFLFHATFTPNAAEIAGMKSLNSKGTTLLFIFIYFLKKNVLKRTGKIHLPDWFILTVLNCIMAYDKIYKNNNSYLL